MAEPALVALPILAVRFDSIVPAFGVVVAGLQTRAVPALSLELAYATLAANALRACVLSADNGKTFPE
jgi:hypothetical protein